MFRARDGCGASYKSIREDDAIFSGMEVCVLSAGKSDIFRVTDCPIPSGSWNHHEGLDALLNLMGSRGLKFYRTSGHTEVGGSDGLISNSDVVLVKVNAQWK